MVETGRETGALCVACGLCCDGTLFAGARLEPDEARNVNARSLFVLTREDGSQRLPQPCPALDGTACTIYAERPRTCRDYDCDLVNALAGYELDLGEALAIVRRAHALRDAVAALLPPEPPGARPRRLQVRAQELHQPSLGLPLDPAIREALDALDEVLDYSFRGRRGRR